MTEAATPDDLRLWRLRNRTEQGIVIRDGTYGKPVVHRLTRTGQARATHVVGHRGWPQLSTPSLQSQT